MIQKTKHEGYQFPKSTPVITMEEVDLSLTINNLEQDLNPNTNETSQQQQYQDNFITPLQTPIEQNQKNYKDQHRYPKVQQSIKIPFDKIKFLYTPVQNDGILQSQIRKICSKGFNSPAKYQMILFDYPILLAERVQTFFKRKVTFNLTEANLYAGKIKWDKQRTNFIFYDNKYSPKKCQSPLMQRQQLGSATYKKNGERKPRKIQVFLNLDNFYGQQQKSKQNAFTFNKDSWMELVGRDPMYFEKSNTYQLPYYGRAQKPSSKNFQLLRENSSSNEICFLQGKIDKGVYNLDFTWPISPIQAFQIAMSCFVSRVKD